MLNHVGIIPDGTRRWARNNNMIFYDAYLESMHKLVKFLKIGFDSAVNIQSVYGLSKENLNRPNEELRSVFAAEAYLIESLLPEICETYRCSVYFAGLPSLLPEEFFQAINKLVEDTKIYETTAKKIYLLLGYNPWDEIKYACSKSEKSSEIRKYLWVKEDLDLIIRTGAGKLISNFLPLQSGYAEFVFFEQLFNDLSDEIFTQALLDFPHYGKRLGGK